MSFINIGLNIPNTITPQHWAVIAVSGAFTVAGALINSKNSRDLVKGSKDQVTAAKINLRASENNAKAAGVEIQEYSEHINDTKKEKKKTWSSDKEGSTGMEDPG